jgi:4-hydroxy-3-methylbut-2-enyl diphosphate reductase
MIYISPTCGLCAGAKQAYDTARQTLKSKKTNQHVILYKKLLHNRDVIANLYKLGAVEKDDFDELGKDDIVIIRAHGETEEFFHNLDELGIKKENQKDCTCPNVQRIHDRIAKKYHDGYSIIIIGKYEHPEVIGSNSCCNNEGKIVKTREEVDLLPMSLGQKIFITGQTTFRKEKFIKLSDLIKQKYNSFHVEFDDTCICSAQQKIQDDSVEMAKQCQTVIVIGSEESSNTWELLVSCKSVCEDSILIESRNSDVPGRAYGCKTVEKDGKSYKIYESFDSGIIQRKFDFSRNIGITGGASALKCVIRECKQLLEYKQFITVAGKKIKEKIAEYNQLLSQNEDIILKRTIEQFVAIGLSEKAKMVRGSLIALGYKMIRKEADKLDYSIDLAAAYEIFETSILVHDDVFDEADDRRGVKTIHKTNIDHYKKYNDKPEKESRLKLTSEASAICMGDLGFYYVNERILDAYQNDANLSHILKYFNNVVITTIKGEMIDVMLPLEEQLNIRQQESLDDLVLKIDTMKTAEYTIIGPLGLGMILGTTRTLFFLIENILFHIYFIKYASNGSVRISTLLLIIAKVCSQ